MSVSQEPNLPPFPLNEWDGCTCPGCGAGEDEDTPLRLVEKIERTFQVGRASLTAEVMSVDASSENPDEEGPSRIECQECWTSWSVPPIEWQ